MAGHAGQDTDWVSHLTLNALDVDHEFLEPLVFSLDGVHVGFLLPFLEFHDGLLVLLNFLLDFAQLLDLDDLLLGVSLFLLTFLDDFEYSLVGQDGLAIEVKLEINILSLLLDQLLKVLVHQLLSLGTHPCLILLALDLDFGIDHLPSHVSFHLHKMHNLLLFILRLAFALFNFEHFLEFFHFFVKLFVEFFGQPFHFLCGTWLILLLAPSKNVHNNIVGLFLIRLWFFRSNFCFLLVYLFHELNSFLELILFLVNVHLFLLLLYYLVLLRFGSFLKFQVWLLAFIHHIHVR